MSAGGTVWPDSEYLYFFYANEFVPDLLTEHKEYCNIGVNMGISDKLVLS
jgi:hypothetical protein